MFCGDYLTGRFLVLLFDVGRSRGQSGWLEKKGERCGFVRGVFQGVVCLLDVLILLRTFLVMFGYEQKFMERRDDGKIGKEYERVGKEYERIYARMCKKGA